MEKGAGAGRRESRGKAREKTGKFQRNRQEMADPEYKITEKEVEKSEGAER
jgi:hypothetical protein